MIAQVHEEKLTLDNGGEERGANEGKSVAAELVEERMLEEGGFVRDSTFAEPSSKEATVATSRNEGPETDTPTTKTHPVTLNFLDAMKDVVTIPPSALATTRIIEDLGLITYPEGITGPKQELNVSLKKGKFM